MEIKRRDFITLLGGATGAVALGTLGLDQVIDVPVEVLERAVNGPGIETWKNTICRQCPGGCGVSVRLVDDIPVYVKGNPLYPVNQGGLCPSGYSTLEKLFNPDRIKGPLRRVGPAGAGTWEPIGWEEALDLVADKLIELRNGNRSHHMAFLGSQEHGLMKEYITRFMHAYGSPNYYQFSAEQNDTVPFNLVHGKPDIPTYDILNTNLIVSFGSNFLDEGYSPVYYTKLFSRRKAGTDAKAPIRLIQIESRMSLTAANSERWIPILPGTYGALALGLAHVLIREELYDADFVNASTFGFEDWIDPSGQLHTGYKTLVLEDYFPERVSNLTGVPSATILEVARELGNTRPALVLGNQGTVDNTNGTYAMMAVHSLNALLGNFEKEGGLFFQDAPPFGNLPLYQEDATAQAGNRQTPIAQSIDETFPLADFSIESFTRNALSGQPYPVELLFLHGGNPLFQTLNHFDFAEAIRQIPLVVSFDSFVNETSEYADLILPEHTFLESWDEISNRPSLGFSHVGIQQPVIDPLYETRHAAEILSDLARRIGGTVASAFPFESYQEAIRDRMRGIYDSGEGAIAAEGIQQAWLDYLQQRGWHIGQYSSFEEFWRLLLNRGGWWDPVRRLKGSDALFQTPSGKYEFFSQTLKESIESRMLSSGITRPEQEIEQMLDRLYISARGDAIYLPHHEPIPEDEEGLPLYLTTFQVLTNRDGQSSNLPMMQEMFGYAMRQYWRSWVEINPQTAQSYGINDGDWVWVHSAVGSIRVQAKLYPGIVPGVVSIPFGLGHTSYGRYARGHGVNPHTIMKNMYDMLGGKPALQATMVDLSLTA